MSYIDIASNSINKFGEELCGDKIEVYKSSERTIAVLADGLGSGVKANILATLTTKILITMLKKGESIEETIDTIINTLPVCQVRQIAYATFGIIEISKDNYCKIIEYDNPPIFHIRNGKIINNQKIEKYYGDKKILFSSFQLKKDDYLTLTSDGVIHAGVGYLYNHGWQWSHVADHLSNLNTKTAFEYNYNLIGTCKTLYDNKPGDDTSSVTLSLKEPKYAHIFTGPPEDREMDAILVKKWYNTIGKKIVCGGTAANIVARELEKDLITSFDYVNKDIPPIAFIDKVDLVTEGVVTLKKVIQILNNIAESDFSSDLHAVDGATLLVKEFLLDSTHLCFWVGKAVNPAHQDPKFPYELSIKLEMIKKIDSLLSTLGKNVEIRYF